MKAAAIEISGLYSRRELVNGDDDSRLAGRVGSAGSNELNDDDVLKAAPTVL
jgi:hypothetical protein